MFEYYYNGESHLGCIRHFGEFQGAESTIAMLTTQSQLPEKDKGTVEFLVFDFNTTKVVFRTPQKKTINNILTTFYELYLRPQQFLVLALMLKNYPMNRFFEKFKREA